MGKNSQRRRKAAAKAESPPSPPSPSPSPSPSLSFILKAEWEKYVEEDLVRGVSFIGNSRRPVEEKDRAPRLKFLTGNLGRPVDDKFMKEFERRHVHVPDLREKLTSCGYYEQLRKSQGYEVSMPPFEIDYGLVIEPTNPSTKLLRGCARFAVGIIQKIKKREHELVEVVRANVYHHWTDLYLFTFTARDKSAANQPPQTFQAMALAQHVNSRDYLITQTDYLITLTHRFVFDQYRDMRLDVDRMSYEELLALGDRIGNVNTGPVRRCDCNVLGSMAVL
ncbi:hypothetical protein Tsubulata_020265 [Turnera subulata]|uniref:RING-type E3 ubiquitin transferase n=1 Tax=Turnera subulata TaxID=218843 RepID=A0A9Q0JMU6_9ROSI|nr:hypothetical protein Tsubulata_020265 [Turnera subulata]